MDLLINNFRVKVEIVPFEGNTGFIIIVFPKSKNKKAVANLSEVSQKLRQHFFSEGGIMDNFYGGNPGKEGYQLRIPEREPLAFIDMVRMLGYSVKQEVILG